MVQVIENIETNVAIIIVVLFTVAMGIIGLVNMWKGNSKLALVMLLGIVFSLGGSYLILN